MQDTTIRVVPPSPSGSVAPLNVRKRSNGSGTSSTESQAQVNVKTSNEHLGRRRANDNIGGLAVIDEDSTLPSVPPETPTIVRKKRSGWFGLNKKAAEQETKPSRSSTPEPFRDLDDRRERKPSAVLVKPTVLKSLPPEPPASAQSSEFPIRKPQLGGRKKGLSRWLGRIGGEKEDGQAGKRTVDYYFYYGSS